MSVARFDNIHPSKLAKMDYSTREHSSKIAVFPSGYQAKGQTHSPRAVKQLRKLMEIKQDNSDTRCIVMYVVQRDDVCCLQPSNGDELYKQTVMEAKECGIEFIGIVVQWVFKDGKMSSNVVRTDLPIVIPA